MEEEKITCRYCKQEIGIRRECGNGICDEKGNGLECYKHPVSLHFDHCQKCCPNGRF
jgi:hypothetical protein